MFRQDAGGYRGTEPDSTRHAGQQVSRWEIDFWFMGAWQNGPWIWNMAARARRSSNRDYQHALYACLIEFLGGSVTRSAALCSRRAPLNLPHTRLAARTRSLQRIRPTGVVAQQRQGQQGAGVWGLLTGLARGGDSRNRYSRYGALGPGLATGLCWDDGIMACMHIKVGMQR